MVDFSSLLSQGASGAAGATPVGAAASSIPNIGGAAGPATSGNENQFNDRNQINIQPVGVNIGEILRNFEGPSENGGFGLETRSRYLGPAAVSLTPSLEGFNPLTLALLVAAGAVAFVAVRRFA